MKIDQANQFIATHQSVQEILDAYGLKLCSFQPASEGIENCTLIIKTLDDTFVLRIYRRGKKSDIHVLQELDFVRYLAAHQVQTVPALTTKDGKELARHGEWQAVLIAFQKWSPCYSLHLRARAKLSNGSGQNAFAGSRTQGAAASNATPCRTSGNIFHAKDRHELNYKQGRSGFFEAG